MNLLIKILTLPYTYFRYLRTQSGPETEILYQDENIIKYRGKLDMPDELRIQGRNRTYTRS